MEVIKVIIVTVIALLLLHCSTEATTYTVGDELNWVDPPISTTYSIWASSYVFLKRDVLVFNFNTGIHDVAEVTKEAYQKCNTNSPISIHTQSPVNISLPTRGRKYFISTLNNDCQSGQKLAILVLNHLPPAPPPGLPPAAAPSPAPGPNIVAPSLAETAPSNGVQPPPGPVQNSARSLLDYATFSSHVLVSLVVVLVSQYIL